MNRHYYCKNKERRDLLKGHSSLNGIDFLEVMDDKNLPIKERQCTLAVHLINPLASTITLEKDNFYIDGGVRIKNIHLIDQPVLDGTKKEITLKVDKAGDFSTYTLQMVQDTKYLLPLSTFDPILFEVDFSFKVECPSEFDCKKDDICPVVAESCPDINYLAKDYASFRRLILDRLSVLLPGWQERNPADLQIALVELLAYIGDHLSYYQDAVSTEAYLGTARKRISTRRHARLVDYFMHDGCNARVWIHLKFSGGSVTLKEKTKLLTRCLDTPTVVDIDDEEKIVTQQQPEVFETMFDIQLYEAHNEINFYTWGDSECCLPKGAVKATLCKKTGMSLKAGDFLLFEEVISPDTSEPEDSDPTRRHVVRLTSVDDVTDTLYDPAVPLVNIQWHDDDALPFPFCISIVKENEGVDEPVDNISVARGNIVLADHGRTIQEKETFTPDQIENRLVEPLCLTREFLTCGEDFKLGEKDSAALMMKRKLAKCCPAVILIEDPEGDEIKWKAQKDLLASDKFKEEFVVEIESDGSAYVRFGDDILGKAPEDESKFGAIYRVGNGTDGNVGTGSICHIIPFVGGLTGITAIRNPLPAEGGLDPETIEEVRQFAPEAFRTQERAVTEEDYAEVAIRFSGIQKAVATFKWTGSWFTVFLVVDRKQGKSVKEDEQFKSDMIKHMEKYRMAGFDLELNDPIYVPLDLALSICVKSDYFQSDVKESLLKVFSSFEWKFGQKGFFHPDNFTFAQPLYLSHIYEVAVKVDGVAAVEVTRFERWGKGPNNEINDGYLLPGRLEIIRLDNDPNYPENGKIEFTMKGGM